MTFKKINWSQALRNLVLLTRLIRIDSITNAIKTIILNINLIYVSPGYYTTKIKVIDTPAQSPNTKPTENLWVYLKKKVGKRSPTNKNELIRSLQKSGKNTIRIWHPEAYSMRRRLQAVIDAQAGHTKY